MATVSPWPQLVFNEEYRLIICTICRHALSPRQVGRHVKNKHATLLDSAAIPTIESWALATNAEDKQTFDANIRLPTPITGLNVYGDLYLCNHCNFLRRDSKSVSNHITADHQGKERKDFTSGNSAHQIWGSELKTYTLILAPPPLKEDSRLAQSMRIMQQRIDEMEAQAKLVRPVDDSRQITPFMKRTKWHEVIGGMSHETIQNLCRAIGEDESEIVHIRQVFCDAVAQAHGNAQTASGYYHKLVHSYRKNIVESTPPRPSVEPKTLERYQNNWFSLLLPLLRHPDHPNIFRGACAAATSFPDDQNARNREFISFLITLLQEKSFAPKAALHLSLSLISYNLLTSRHKSASAMSPTLAGIKFISHCFIMEHTYHPALRDYENILESCTTFCENHVQEQSGSMHSEICSILAYAQAHHDDHSIPSIVWAPNRLSFLYREHTISISSLQGMVKALVDRLEEQASHLTFSSKDEMRSRYDLEMIRDDMYYEECDFNFVKHEKNAHLHSGFRYVSHQLQNSPRSHEYLTNSGDWVGDAVEKYNQRFISFQETLALADYITSGGAPRATELFSVQARNTQANQRGIFALHGDILTVTAYHKSQNLTQHPKLIARFVPAPVGRCVVAYLADIVPFHAMLNLTFDPDLKVLHNSDLFFSIPGDAPWDTNRLSNLLRNLGRQHLDFALSVSSYRQIHIAVRKEYCSKIAVEDEEDVGAVQTAHSTTTERNYYAITGSFIRSLTDESISAFRQASYSWHRALGISATPSQSSHATQEVHQTARETHLSPEPTQSNQQRKTIPAIQDAISQTPKPSTATTGLRNPKPFAINPIPASSSSSAIIPRQMSPSPFPTPMDIRVSDSANTQPRIFATPSLPAKRPSHGLPTPNSNDVQAGPKRPRTFERSPPSTETTAVPILQETPTRVSRIVHAEVLDYVPSSHPQDFSQDIDIVSKDPIIHKYMCRMYPNGRFRSPAQRVMVETVCANKSPGATFVLPTAGGKTLAIILPCFVDPKPSMTIAVIPFVQLLDSILATCLNVGVHAVEYKTTFHGTATLLLVSPELLAGEAFKTYFARRKQDGKITRVIFDEVHHIVTASDWRKMFAGIVWIQRETIPKFLLTATLPTHLEPLIQTWFAPADNPIPLFRSSTERPNLSYNVRHHPDMDTAAEVKAIRALEKELPEGKKMLVFGGLTSHIDELAQALNAPRYYHKWQYKERDFVRFSSGQDCILVGSSGIGSGTDVSDIHTVLHIGGLWGFLDYIQESGRGGRRGEPALSIVICTPSHLKDLTDFWRPETPKHKKTDCIALAAYLKLETCRRASINLYFDGVATPCSGRPVEPCDNCRPLDHQPFQFRRCPPPLDPPARPTIVERIITPLSDKSDWFEFQTFMLSSLEYMRGCPKCLLARGPTFEAHSVQDCPFPPLFNEIKNFKTNIRMHYTANACHFLCDLPQSLCNISQHAVGHCRYRYHVMAICLCLHTDPKHHHHLRDLCGDALLTDMTKYIKWLSVPQVRYGRIVTNAIIVFAEFATSLL